MAPAVSPYPYVRGIGRHGPEEFGEPTDDPVADVSGGHFFVVGGNFHRYDAPI